MSASSSSDPAGPPATNDEPAARARVLDNIGALGSVIALLGVIGLLAMQMGMAQDHPWLVVAVPVLYVGGVLLTVVRRTGRARVSVLNVVPLFVIYAILGFWDLLSIGLVMAFVVVEMILGPLLGMATIVAVMMLGIFVIETVLGIPLDGISGPESWGQAGIFVAVLVVGVVVLRWRFGRDEGEDPIMDAYARTHARILGLLHLAILACGGPSPDHEEP
ncbi:MAG: hypothetical protein AAF799_31100 [Myxococcota bacterium]